MKRSSSSSLFTPNLWLIWKTIILLTLIFLLITLFRIQFYFYDDDEFSSSRRSKLPVFDDKVFDGNPRIAFMFLARRDLPLDFLWQSFFENADAANYSIYVHSEPGFVLDETTTRSSFFYNKQLTNSIKW